MTKLTQAFAVLSFLCIVGITGYLVAIQRLRADIQTAQISCERRLHELTDRYSSEINGLRDYLRREYGVVSSDE